MSTKTLLFPTLLTVILISSCGDKNQKAMQGPPPVSVVTREVSASDAVYFDEYPATVKALSEVELRAQVNGYITGIHFKEGDQVKKGRKLYSIDQQQTEAAYKQALANLSVQQANLEKAKRDVERYRELDKRDAIAKQQVDYAEAAYTAAQKQVEAAKAAVQSSQTNVRYSTIVAPFDGTIGISAVRLGASISPGVTLLNTISSDDPVGVDITIDQSEIYRFSNLYKESKNAEKDSTFTLAFQNEVYPYPGKISILDRAVDPMTGTLKMRVTFPNPDHTLRAGMSGTMRVKTSAEGALLIPAKAVNEQLGEFFVYIPDSSKATQRRVRLGKQVGSQVIIKDGLKAGETIITEGLQNLREGTPISIAPPETTKK
ncbi:MAG TPA: efflux RND transporter periplasmic adaptor subunit [Cyclobacteriaceae bacterium]|nr:efflux RND transporter periplasmic adaptor subunit [Cyclobacteriaceae bacterium]